MTYTASMKNTAENRRRIGKHISRIIIKAIADPLARVGFTRVSIAHVSGFAKST